VIELRFYLIATLGTARAYQASVMLPNVPRQGDTVMLNRRKCTVSEIVWNVELGLATIGDVMLETP